MTALDVIRNIILLSGIGKMFEGLSTCFYWDDLAHKLWIDTFGEALQKKIAQDLKGAGIVQPSQIEMSEYYHSVIIVIPKVNDINEIRKLITDQLDSGCEITDPDFSVKLLFKGVLIDSYSMDYGDLDTPLKVCVRSVFNSEDAVKMGFVTRKYKTKYDINETEV